MPACLDKIIMMNFKLILPPSWLRFLMITLLMLAAFFRFTNLDQKVYWFDEIATSVKISAYTDYEDESFNGQIIGIKDLRKKTIYPDPEISVIDVIKKLSVDDPKHTPLYFVMARLWIQWFGSSIGAIRFLSVLISLFIFISAYWLCLELFRSSLVAGLAIALIAVSPLHFLYAKEAKMYGLNTVIILLSSAALLRAIRQKTKMSWAIYAVTVSLGLYTHTLFALVAIGHGIYLIITEGSRCKQTLINYLMASGIGFVSFIPWIMRIFAHPNGYFSGLAWQSQPLPLPSLMTWWAVNLSRIFVDFNPTYQLGTDFSSFKNFLSVSLISLLLILVFYSIYFLVRHSPKEIWLFVFVLIGVTGITLAAQDILEGGIRSANPRYLMASYLGIHLAVAYLLGTKIKQIPPKIAQQKFWRIVMIGLILSGIISCGIILPKQKWWNKNFSSVSPQISGIINQADSPLLVITDFWRSKYNFWSLNQFLEKKVKIQLVCEDDFQKIPDGFSDVFLFNPSEKLLEKLSKQCNFNLKLIPGIDQEQMTIWQIR